MNCKIVGFCPEAEDRDLREIIREGRVSERQEEREARRAKAREFAKWNKKGLGVNPFECLKTK